MRIGSLSAALLHEPPSASIKYALSLLGLTMPYVRLPLLELSEPAKATIAEMIRAADEGLGQHPTTRSESPDAQPANAFR